MSEAPLIDRAVLADLIEAIGREGTRSVIELFLEESRLYLATIADALADDAGAASRDRARRAAHSLKSGAGQIGAAAMGAAAEAVERAIEGGADAAGLSRRIAALRERAAETATALAQVLTEP